MLDFILSKLNLLILVTAIFAIISFFALGLADISKAKVASEEASRVKEQSFALVSSPSYCFSDSYTLPGDLSIAGSSFYYVLQVSTQEVRPVVNGQAMPLTQVIFSIYPREEVKREFRENSSYTAKAIAADSFRTDAAVQLYSRDYHGSFYDGDIVTGAGADAKAIWVDPQAQVPADKVEFVKEIQGGKATLYIIGCNSALCDAAKTQLGNAVHPQTATEGGGFSC